MKNYLLLGLALCSAALTFAQNGRQRAEVFLQIDDRGSYTVYLDQESIGSSKGKFRFYDVYERSANLTITQGNRQLYRSQISVRPNERLILSYSIRQGLRTIKTLNMYRNGQYALDDFDAEQGAYNTGIVPPRQNTNTHQNTFDNLYSLIKRESFDDNRLKLVQVFVNNGATITTSQTISLLQQFTRDEGKINAAKTLFVAVLDPQNYYLVKDVFTFSDTKRQFTDFLANNTSSRRYQITQQDFERLRTSVKNESFDDEKTKLIQSALQNAALSTAQVGELFKLYSFEEKGLNMVKLAYDAVVDRQNYFTLKELFRFRSYQDSFLDFLARR